MFTARFYRKILSNKQVSIKLLLKRLDICLSTYEYFLLLQRNLVEFLVPTCQLTTASDSRSRASDAIFYPLNDPAQNIHAHKIKTNCFKSPIIQKESD